MNTICCSILIEKSQWKLITLQNKDTWYGHSPIWPAWIWKQAHYIQAQYIFFIIIDFCFCCWTKKADCFDSFDSLRSRTMYNCYILCIKWENIAVFVHLAISFCSFWHSWSMKVLQNVFCHYLALYYVLRQAVMGLNVSLTKYTYHWPKLTVFRYNMQGKYVKTHSLTYNI